MKTNKIQKGLGKKYYEITASSRDLTSPVSKSLLWAFFQSPYKWFNSIKSANPTPAMEFGSLVHCAALTPNLLLKEFTMAPFDSWRSKESQDFKKRAEADGRVAVKEEDWNRAMDIAGVFISSSEMPISYQTEVAVFGEIDGIEVKGMIDIVPTTGDSIYDRSLYDLKTTASIESLEELQRTIINRGYHWQAALYLDLWNAATGENRDSFVFIFIETSAPFEMASVRLTADFLDLGRYGRGKHKGYLHAISLWRDCVDSNTWPKRVEGITTIDVPSWILPKTN